MGETSSRLQKQHVQRHGGEHVVHTTGSGERVRCVDRPACPPTVPLRVGPTRARGSSRRPHLSPATSPLVVLRCPMPSQAGQGGVWRAPWGAATALGSRVAPTTLGNTLSRPQPTVLKLSSRDWPTKSPGQVTTPPSGPLSSFFNSLLSTHVGLAKDTKLLLEGGLRAFAPAVPPARTVLPQVGAPRSSGLSSKVT